MIENIETCDSELLLVAKMCPVRLTLLTVISPLELTKSTKFKNIKKCQTKANF